MIQTPKYIFEFNKTPRNLTEGILPYHPDRLTVQYDVVDERIIDGYGSAQFLVQSVRGTHKGIEESDGRTLFLFHNNGELFLNKFDNFHFLNDEWRGLGKQLMEVTLKYVAGVYEVKPPFDAEYIEVGTFIEDPKAMRILMINGFRPKEMPPLVGDYFNNFYQRDQIPYGTIMYIINHDIEKYKPVVRVKELKERFSKGRTS